MRGTLTCARLLVVAIGVVGALALPQAAQAAPATVCGGAVPCQPDGGVTFCSDDPRSTVPAFDGVPIDVNVALPNEAQFGSGPYPLMMMFHGYGGDKIGLGGMQHWLARGYAPFSMTHRGFHAACGSAE